MLIYFNLRAATTTKRKQDEKQLKRTLPKQAKEYEGEEDFG